eukprot:3907802-Amphidinium_carterae.1
MDGRGCPCLVSKDALVLASWSPLRAALADLAALLGDFTEAASQSAAAGRAIACAAPNSTFHVETLVKHVLFTTIAGGAPAEGPCSAQVPVRPHTQQTETSCEEEEEESTRVEVLDREHMVQGRYTLAAIWLSVVMDSFSL